MPQIVAIASDMKPPSEIAYHHVRYYAPSVSQYILVVYGGPDDEGNAREAYKDLGNVAVHLAPRARANEERNTTKDRNEADAINRFVAESDTYILHLDLDEFHVYPAPINSIVERMANLRLPALLGYFRDRVCVNPDGNRVILREIDESTDLWKTFPLMTTFTRDVLGACEEKIMIAHRDIQLIHGRHAIRINGTANEKDERATQNAECWPSIDPSWNGNDFFVHHFKWTSNAIALCTSPIARERHNSCYVAELERLRHAFVPPNKLIFDQRVKVKSPCRATCLPANGLWYPKPVN